MFEKNQERNNIFDLK